MHLTVKILNGEECTLAVGVENSEQIGNLRPEQRISR